MTSLSQRLLHTSLAHRVGSRAISGNASTPAPRITSQQAAEGARHLLPVDEQDPNPIRPFEKNQINPPHNFSSSSLYPERRPDPRPPLLGPPNRIAKQIDPFHLTGQDPLDHIHNPGMARAFVDQMGRIKSRAQTGLTWKNQRKVGKLVRRARAMGLISRWTDLSPEEAFVRK